MDRRAIFQIGGGALAGLLIASAAWSVQATGPKAKTSTTGSGATGDIDSLRTANAKLVESQQAADKTIAELRARLPVATQPVPMNPGPGSGGPFGGDGGVPVTRQFKETTAEDWNRMAKHGGISYTLPCLRPEPWTPGKFQLNRLSLAPQDAAMIREAYEHSNKRVADLIRPLCAKTLGKSDAMDIVGAKGCLDAILAHAKTTDKQGTDQALVRIARLNGGQTDVKPPEGSGFEHLLLAITRELPQFEAELASKLGPEEGKRISLMSEMCMDRGYVRARADGE